MSIPYVTLNFFIINENCSHAQTLRQKREGDTLSSEEEKQRLFDKKKKKVFLGVSD